MASNYYPSNEFVINLYNDSSLNKSPRVNEIERRGGLPPNVRARARAIKRKNPDWSLARCIATAMAANRYSEKTGGDLFFKGKQTEGGAAQARHRASNADWDARIKGKRKK